MKIGFNLLLWTAHVEEAHLPILQALKQQGYDGVEIPVMKIDDQDHYRRLGRQVRDLGLACTCSTAVVGEDCDPIHENAAYRQAGVDYLKRVVDCAQALGSNVVCGPTFQTLGRFTGVGPTQQEKQWAAGAHRQVAQHAAGADVLIAAEPLNRFECYLLNTLADAAEHAKEVNHPNFGVLFDTFHANMEEKDPVGCIALHGEAIRHVHISENDRGVPGAGHIDFAGAFSALKKSGYHDWLVVEAFGRALPDLAAATRVWRDFFPSREAVYTQAIGFVREKWEAV